MATAPLHPPRGGALRPGGRPRAARILPHLLIGGYPFPDDAAWLRATHGVTVVVSLQDDADLAGKGLTPAELMHAYRAHHIQFHRVPVADGDTEALADRLDRIVTLLDRLLKSSERVYVHCNGGLNRAPTVAIAYLHARHGTPLDAARDLVKQRTHCVPYMRLLKAYYGKPS